MFPACFQLSGNHTGEERGAPFYLSEKEGEAKCMQNYGDINRCRGWGASTELGNPAGSGPKATYSTSCLQQWPAFCLWRTSKQPMKTVNSLPLFNVPVIWYSEAC